LIYANRTIVAGHLARSVSTNSVQLVEGLQKKVGVCPEGRGVDSLLCIHLQLLLRYGEPAAVLVAGISPRRDPDGAYQTFLKSVLTERASGQPQ